jgi:hypothetical protein
MHGSPCRVEWNGLDDLLGVIRRCSCFLGARSVVSCPF